MKKTLLLILFFIATILCAQTSLKREFRGAWVASVANLDWPTSRSLSSEAQKAELVTMLDELKAAGINAVVFQIRPECDALYQSNFEPWSYWLTGEQGKAPSPFYDPLEFAVEESHKRGIELHAWLNPYRAEKTIGNYTISSNHVVKAHPDWVFTRGTLKMLDPGLPEVRQHILNVILDIVDRYDVDGIHMDDYFYPYEGMGSEDAATFAKDPRGFTDLGDWRRDNINILLKDINDNVKSIKPYVKFGMSPFGIWKSGVPPGITGMSSYSQIYCDALAWLHEGSVDYLTPQLYWRIGGSQDYVKLLKWWADSTSHYNRHFYPGQIVGTDRSYTTAEIPNQIKEDRKLPETVQGSVLFRALLITGNALSVEDSLKNLYKNVALAPVMSWIETTPPNAPQNLRFEKVEGKGVSQLVWEGPSQATDGDTAARYVIYRSSSSTPAEADLNNPANIADVIGLKNYIPKKADADKKYFFITSLDRNTNESVISNVLEIPAPSLPVLVYPANNNLNQKDTVELKWSFASNAGGYNLQVSTDPTFASSVVYNLSNLTDTTYEIYGLYGQTKYYWRVKASNAVAAGDFTEPFSFTTGFPLAPELVFPAYGTYEVPVNPELKWNKNSVATSYQIQLGTAKPLSSATIVVDTTVTDTSIVVTTKLLNNKVYYWRGLAFNDYGTSLWSDYNAFKTIPSIGIDDDNEPIPTEYALQQNYPNPFNPTTIISFKLKEAGMVSLKVYDILGKEVADLVNEYKNAGTYNVEFNPHSFGQNLASGLYIYTIRANNFLFSRKMLLLK